MRTIIDLPEEQVQALERLQRRDDASRAELIRRAVDLYIETETRKNSADTLDGYYGFLSGTGAFDGLDGVAYQQKTRAEWDDRDNASARWSLNEPGQPPYKK